MSEHSHFPVTKSARQQRIIELLATGQVRSQTELADRLNADGLSVTQATLSPRPRRARRRQGPFDERRTGVRRTRRGR